MKEVDSLNELERIFSNFEQCFLKNFESLLGTNQLRPLLNSFQTHSKIKEKNNKIYVDLELPNLSKDHIVQLSVNRDNLIIEGTLDKKSKMNSEKGEGYSQHYSEYFYQTIPLSYRVTAKGAKAEYDGNKLRVTLPKVGDLDEGFIDVTYK